MHFVASEPAVAEMHDLDDASSFSGWFDRTPQAESKGPPRAGMPS